MGGQQRRGWAGSGTGMAADSAMGVGASPTSWKSEGIIQVFATEERMGPPSQHHLHLLEIQEVGRGMWIGCGRGLLQEQG